MITFKKYFTESVGKRAVIAYGRYNPPTIGHEALVNKVREVSAREDADGFIIPTHSHDNKKNPLTFKEKASILNKMIEGNSNVVILEEGKTLISLLQHLQSRGYTHIIHIAGSDRIPEFEGLVGRYNNTPDTKGNIPFAFRDYQFESSGDRDPDSEGVEGMSASKLRQLAIDGNVEEFKQGMSDRVDDLQKEETFNIIRERLTK